MLPQELLGRAFAVRSSEPMGSDGGRIHPGLPSNKQGGRWEGEWMLWSRAYSGCSGLAWEYPDNGADVIGRGDFSHPHADGIGRPVSGL
ncbi:hypothetical protein CDAR_521061 [Caerostris darwini]|uniref:Uncharacterized protein n=1 Tax=Caerostris darwini TaxID=1538125 RepID=A0AAV4V9I5_9ARAC|nr:hypothetical protein CDAR_521061 [Caerostris darwini]